MAAHYESVARRGFCLAARASMPREPIASGALRRRDLRLRHLGGDLTTIPHRLALTAHSGQVEPLMRGDEIGGHRPPGRVFDPQVEQDVARGIRLSERCAFDLGEFVASHCGLPCPCAPFPDVTGPRLELDFPARARRSSPGEFKDGLNGAMNEV